MYCILFGTKTGLRQCVPQSSLYADCNLLKISSSESTSVTSTFFRPIRRILLLAHRRRYCFVPAGMKGGGGVSLRREGAVDSGLLGVVGVDMYLVDEFCEMEGAGDESLFSEPDEESLVEEPEAFERVREDLLASEPREETTLSPNVSAASLAFCFVSASKI